jgi:hypothetical protein
VLSYVSPCFHPYFNNHFLASNEDFPMMKLFLSKIMLTMLTLSVATLALAHVQGKGLQGCGPKGSPKVKESVRELSFWEFGIPVDS